MSEILAPAGNAECAKAAIHAGADAIYLGYSSFSARASAENFDAEALKRIIDYAHFTGVKVYVAMNTLVKDGETESFLSTLLAVWNMGADAIIMQDILLGRFIHERYPEIVLHLSTQAGVCNREGARLAQEYGFSRVILARETPFSEIEKISSFIETEVFVQGALCTCFSGQCYFSSFAGGNSGNRGKCKQPCRKLYSFDRKGNEDKKYALSLADLCVAEDIKKYERIGVRSFKIEGRMRRAEYVSAAVRYYRFLSDGEDGKNKSKLLSDLKRTYNRGNYTKGLAFGQDKSLISRDVQGHIGEEVGTVKTVRGKYFVESSFLPVSGDAFKILRKGREIGGAVYEKSDRKGFYLLSKTRLSDGDKVFVTTDVSLNRRLLSYEKRIPVSLELCFEEEKPAVVECKKEHIRVCSDLPLPSAKTRSLTEEELTACFLKTDGLPVEVQFNKISLRGNVFLAKSELNSLRRNFYSALFRSRTKTTRKVYEFTPVSVSFPVGKNNKTAVIASDFSKISGNSPIGVAIFKPDDYSRPLPTNFLNASFEKFIYYPAYASSADLEAIGEMVGRKEIEGIYAENYGGILFAKEKGVRLFAGTGFNLTNAVAVGQLLREPVVKYYAVSKELDEKETEKLGGEKAFALSSGDIKLMDLCYCPFDKTCSVCDKRRIYTLRDESGRAFSVRRYRSASGECRFEIFNCAKLIGQKIKTAGALLDCTTIKDANSAIDKKDEEEAQKNLYGNYTAGHRRNSVL